MKQNLFTKFKRAGYAASATLIALVAAVPLLATSPASAAQVTARKIVLDSSQKGVTTTYRLTFTPVTTEQELIVDFCSNSPLVGDTCSFSAATVPTVASPTSSVGTATAVGSGSPVHTIKVTGLTMTGGTPFSINFTAGVTNPTSVGSYYARILTFATGNATGYAPANTTGNTPTSGTFVDNGGIALADTDNISITAKVFETLSFCVFQTSCGTAASLALGDATTGALSSSTAEINAQAQYTLATNAGSGVAVTMTGTTLCRLSPLNFTNCPTGASANTITAMGTTAIVSAAGSEQFGMCAGKNGSAALTVATAYNDTINNCPTTAQATGSYAGTSKFGFDDTNTTGTNATAGSTVLTSTGAVASVTSNFAFLANIAATTEAGIYQSNLNFVATGTF